MTDYSNWKVLKSVYNYYGDDPKLMAEAEAKRAEYVEAANWCDDNGYMMTDNDTYYLTAPVTPHTPTHEEVRQMRIAYRREHIDDQTAERSRKTANSTWTEDDEDAYLALDAEVTAYIEEHYPYPDDANDDEVA